MENKYKFHFTIKEDYLLDKAMSLDVYKMLSIHEKIKNILLNIKMMSIILIILNHDNMY